MSATPWGEEPPPIVITRFLYGKATPIEDTSSNVQAQPGQLWRIFTDDEEQRLQQGWNALSEAQRDKAREAHRNLMRTAANKSNPSKSKGDANTQTSEQQNRSSEDERNQEASVLERTIANPDAAPDSLQQHVAIGPDALFTCDLSVLELFPVFWPGPHVPVQVSLVGRSEDQWN